MITIRKTEKSDLDTVMEIYAIAKKFMDASGNPTQWEVGHPTRNMIEADVEKGESYVILEDGVIHGVFMFMQREDPAYSYIEDGAWQNDLPYGTIHRVASDGHIKRMLDRCVEFCRTFTENLRIDTHKDNVVMQKAITRNGFVRCGIVYMVHDGTPRIAYQMP